MGPRMKHTTNDRPAYLRPVAADERAPEEAVTAAELEGIRHALAVELDVVFQALGALEDQAALLDLAAGSALMGTPFTCIIGEGFERLLDKIVDIRVRVGLLETRLEK